MRAEVNCDEEQVKNALSMAFPTAKAMSRDECRRACINLIAVTEESAVRMLPSILVSLIDHHAVPNDLSYDIGTMLDYLALHYLVEDTSMPQKFKSDEAVRCLAENRFFNEIKLRQWAQLDAQCSSAILCWLTCVRKWEVSSIFQEEVEAALAFWDQRSAA